MKTIHIVLAAGALVFSAAEADAGSISTLTSFSPNTTALSADVNGNFSALKNAVNDNDTRISGNSNGIGVLQTSVLSHSASIATLQSNPSITGNFTLPETTDANTGVIMKGTVPFLHNYGTNNVFLGENSGNFNSSLTGDSNVAIGLDTLHSDTSGYYDIAVGNHALHLNDTGEGNVAVGYYALGNNTGGSSNIAIGTSSLVTNSTGADNVAVGPAALYVNTTGTYNTAIGSNTLTASTGSYNIALGSSAGKSLTTGNYNIDIGNQGVAGEAQVMRIGGTSQTRTFVSGIRDVTTGSADAITVVIDSNGQLGTVSSSRSVKDHIRTMGDASNILNRLRPVTFYYKSDQDPKGRHLQYGLVAEEVNKVAPNLVVHDRTGKPKTIYYRFLAPMLLNEYQKQGRIIARQQREIEQLKQQTAHVADLERQVRELDGLRQQVAQLNTYLAARN